ncbi:MAG: hypothetical protein ACI9HK_005305, partial [Pirellulaceae bacterium]
MQTAQNVEAYDCEPGSPLFRLTSLGSPGLLVITISRKDVTAGFFFESFNSTSPLSRIHAVFSMCRR